MNRALKTEEATCLRPIREKIYPRRSSYHKNYYLYVNLHLIEQHFCAMSPTYSNTTTEILFKRVHPLSQETESFVFD